MINSIIPVIPLKYNNENTLIDVCSWVASPDNNIIIITSPIRFTPYNRVLADGLFLIVNKDIIYNDAYTKPEKNNQIALIPDNKIIEYIMNAENVYSFIDTCPDNYMHLYDVFHVHNNLAMNIPMEYELSDDSKYSAIRAKCTSDLYDLFFHKTRYNTLNFKNQSNLTDFYNIITRIGGSSKNGIFEMGIFAVNPMGNTSIEQLDSEIFHKFLDNKIINNKKTYHLCKDNRTFIKSCKIFGYVLLTDKGMRLFNYLKDHPEKLKIGSIKTLIKKMDM